MQRHDGCTGKIRHRGKGGALKHIASLQEPGMKPYRCQQCRGWHIGHASREDGIQSRLDRLIGPDPRSLPGKSTHHP